MTVSLDILVTPFLLWALWRLARIDLSEGRLPDRLTLPLIVAGLALAALRTGAVPWPEAASAATGYAVPAVIGWAYWRTRGIDGLGHGDAKLMGAAGAWLGPVLLSWTVLAAALAALAAIGLASRRGFRAPTDGIAFGPWLAGAFAAGHLVRLVVPDW